MFQDPKLVCVRSCQGLDLAQIYKSKLEAHGIPVLLKYEAVGRVYGLTVDGMGRVRIMVPENYAQEAADLIADRDENELEQDWDLDESSVDPSPEP